MTESKSIPTAREAHPHPLNNLGQPPRVLLPLLFLRFPPHPLLNDAASLSVETQLMDLVQMSEDGDGDLAPDW